jgi:RecB family exonuclease
LIWQLAGIVGVAPGPLTLRELIWMVESRRREAWQHTSAVLATLANIHRDPKKKPRPFTTQEFHPMAEGKTPAKPPKADIQLLKRVFVERK